MSRVTASSASADDAAKSSFERLNDRTLLFTTSWDDGLKTDLRLVELASKYSIPVMIFACPQHGNGKAMSANELAAVATYAEVGSHTLQHSPIDHCSPDQAREFVRNGRLEVEAQIGREAPHFSLVGGRYNRVNLAAIANLVSTVRSTDMFSFSLPRQTALIKPSLQIRFTGRTHPLKVLQSAATNLSPRQAINVGVATLRGSRQHDFLQRVPTLVSSNPLALHLWGHSEDVERAEAWEALEDLFRFLNRSGAKACRYSDFTQAASALAIGTPAGMP